MSQDDAKSQLQTSAWIMTIMMIFMIMMMLSMVNMIMATKIMIMRLELPICDGSRDMNPSDGW